MPQNIVPMEIQGKTGNPIIDIVNKIGAGTLAKIFFLLAIVCFIFTFATISCTDNTYEIRGYELIFGKTVAIGKTTQLNTPNMLDIKTNYVVALMFVCCVVGFVVSLINPSKSTIYTAMGAAILGILSSLVFILFFDAFVADYRQKTFANVPAYFIATRGFITIVIPILLSFALFAVYRRLVNLNDRLKLQNEPCLYSVINEELEVEYARRMKLRSEIALSADKLSPVSMPIRRTQKIAAASSSSKPENTDAADKKNKKPSKASKKKAVDNVDKVTTFPEIMPEEETQTTPETVATETTETIAGAEVETAAATEVIETVAEADIVADGSVLTTAEDKPDKELESEDIDTGDK